MSKDPLHFLFFLIDSSYRERAVFCTNKRLPTNTEPIEEEEFVGFLGVLLRNKIDVAELWSRWWPHFLEFAAFSMSRNRFQTILKYLTFYDVDEAADNANNKIL